MFKIQCTAKSLYFSYIKIYKNIFYKYIYVKLRTDINDSLFI